MRSYLNKLVFFFLSFLGAVLVYLLINPLIIGNIYSFSQPHEFRGASFYNPYENLNSENWKKANFHAHSHSMLGLNGDHSDELYTIRKTYKKLGYDIINISDYMHINKHFEGKKDYVPSYEHGYSFKKTHQLVFGGSSVYYFDYTLYASTSNKQYIIDQLQSSSKLVALAHPSLLNGYTKEDIIALDNYNLFEAVSRFCMSTELWDVALSNGKPVFIIANDDVHDIHNPNEVGQVCTVLNSKGLSESEIIEALKTGKSYGIEMRRQDLTWEQKEVYTKDMIRLESAEIIADEYVVKVNKPIIKIKFIGQNGQVLKEESYMEREDIVEDRYSISSEDTYIRTEITTYDGHVAYLNPIYRFDENPFLFSNIATVNWFLTVTYKLTTFFLIGLIYFLLNSRRKKRKQKRLAFPRIK